jgi:hypothetical protein
MENIKPIKFNNICASLKKEITAFRLELNVVGQRILPQRIQFQDA